MLEVEMTPTQQRITIELYTALEAIGAPKRLLAIVGSWGGTMTEDEVLTALIDWNDRKDAPQH